MKQRLEVITGALLGAVLLWGTGSAVSAQEVAPLASVVQEAVIRALPFEEGRYMLASDGFYCLDEKGDLHDEAAVHYFDHYEIEGILWNGFYYHDASGKWKAGDPYLVQIPSQSVAVAEPADDGLLYEVEAEDEAVPDEATTVFFEGWYLAGNLGKLSGAPKTVYLSGISLTPEAELEGYYYFDAYGRLSGEAGVHALDQVEHGRDFSGDYYFGGPFAALVNRAGETEEGLRYKADGRVTRQGLPDTVLLKRRLNALIQGYEGNWSLCLRIPEESKTLMVGNAPTSAASLIKLFVMARTFRYQDEVLAHVAAQLGEGTSREKAEERLHRLLYDMITVSDNESYNELVRLQTASHDFLEGARAMNAYLEEEGYENTTVQSSLSPSSTAQVSLGGRNLTTVADCARLLEEIQEGTLVSAEASEAMLDLLLAQTNRTKIPTGLPSGVVSANKTGETNSCQHDAAIVYGEDVTYILCIMSDQVPRESEAVEEIRELASVVHKTLTDDE